MKVGVFFGEGFEEIEALTVVDVLRRAKIDARMISVTGGKRVTGSHGICVEMDELIQDTDFKSLEMIVLPGGMPGTLNLEACDYLLEQIRAFDEAGKGLAAICAAPSIFGHLGLLKGKSACCYPGMEEHLTGAQVSMNTTAKAGNIITGRGMGTAIDFALAILEHFQGKEAADQMAADIVYKRS